MERGQTSNDDCAALKRQRPSIKNASDGQVDTLNNTPAPQVYGPEQNALCSRCAGLDIDKLFSAEKPPGCGLRCLNLGTLGPETEASSCSMCQLLNIVKYDEHNDATDYGLYLTTAPFPYGIFPGIMVLAVARLRPDVLKAKSHRLRRRNDHTKYIMLTASSAQTSAQEPQVCSLPGRRIHTSGIDFSVVRGWLDWRKATHPEQCMDLDASASWPNDLRLIDCEHRTVLQSPSPLKYCALSYVWGQKSQSGEHTTEGKLPDVLPQTIEDSMKITLEVGLRYIWVDRYCIDQKNKQEMHTQIQQMDLIYRHAYLTIIAAAGDNPRFGLPGVGTICTRSQYSARIDNHCLVSFLPHPRELVKTSPWASRGWVYQEGYFSRRRLAFTEQEIYFECCGGSARESVARYEHSTYTNLFGNAGYPDETPWAISTHLGRYCGRILSYEEDAIHAFEGIFHAFRNKKYPVYHYLGIPIMPSVIEGSGSSGSIVELSDRSRGECFAAGLCWRQSGKGLRRSQFPTWTWAGWTVPVVPLIPELFRGLETASNERPRVFAERLDGVLVDFEAYDYSSLSARILRSCSNFSHLEAWTITLNIPCTPRHSTGTDDWVEKLGPSGLPRPISAHPAVFEDETTILRLPTYFLHQEFSPDCGGEILGIVLGRSNAPVELKGQEYIFIMIVQDRGDYFERIGHMELSRSAIEVTIKSTREEIDMLNQPPSSRPLWDHNARESSFSAQENGGDSDWVENELGVGSRAR